MIERAADEIANIYWLIDDICDFSEDIQCKRANSILFICAPPDQKMDLESRVAISIQNIDIVLDKLTRKMHILRDFLNDKAYSFIINQVWGWCRNVREAANSGE